MSMPQQRVQEAKKLGFTTCILPKVSLQAIKEIEGVRLIGVRTVNEAQSAIW